MAQIETWYNQDLQQAVKVHYIDGNVFSADNNGNIVGVNVFDGGEPATLGGTVSASIIRADGATVAATGTLSGNKVSVALPQSAYAVPGVISIVVKLTESTTVTTVLAVVGNVYQSTTDTVVDPGTIIPDISTLVAEIEAAVASIPADYSSLWTSLAPAYSTSATYSVGQYVTYDGGLYRCISAITTAESWTAAHWTAVSIGNDMVSLENDVSDLNSNVKNDVGNIVELVRGYIQNNQGIGTTVSSLTPQQSSTLKCGVANCAEGDIFVLYGSGESAGRLWAFIDSSNKMLDRAQANETMNGGYVIAPAGSSKIIINTTGSAYIDRTVKTRIDESVQIANINGYSFISKKYLDSDGDEAPSASRYCTGYIPCGQLAEVKYIGETNRDNICGIAFYDIKKKFLEGYKNNGAKGTEQTVTSPRGTAYCRLSTDKATLEKTYVKLPISSISNGFDKVIDAVSEGVYYVSTSGNDTTGDGTSTYPFATVEKALSSGASKIMVKQGVYDQRIDFSKAIKRNITIISNDPTGKAVFVAPGSFVTSNEESVTGYTNVHKCSYTGTFSAGMRMYQDGVPDASTTISDSERNPYQRGQSCRCLDTKIVPCSSDNVSDALTEIENADVYKYYNDTANSTLYFSRPESVTASNPIMRTVNTTFMYNLNRSFELTVHGIECKYMRFDITGAVAHLYDCKCSYGYGSGGFIYGTCFVEFVGCESCGTHGDGSGDGFNAHSSSTGDPFSKQTVSRLIDCWSHDSLDDGYSDHERCEIEIHGGLFEYNGKAGITPSYGSHCACYNVISRNNYSGFLYLGEATQEEGGKYGQMLCMMCVAENNTDPSSGYGFAVKSNNNSAKLINCKSIGNVIGYYCAGNTSMTLIDCGAANNTTQTGGSGTLTVSNTSVVS